MSDCPFSRRMISFSHKTAVSWSQRTAGPLKQPLAAKREGATERHLKMMKCWHSPSWWTRGQRLSCYVQFSLLFSSLPSSHFLSNYYSLYIPTSKQIILSISTWGNTKIQQREQRRKAKQGDECVWLLRNCLVELRFSGVCQSDGVETGGTWNHFLSLFSSL